MRKKHKRLFLSFVVVFSHFNKSRWCACAYDVAQVLQSTLKAIAVYLVGFPLYAPDTAEPFEGNPFFSIHAVISSTLGNVQPFHGTPGLLCVSCILRRVLK